MPRSLFVPRPRLRAAALRSSAVNKPTTGVVVAVGDGYNSKARPHAAQRFSRSHHLTCFRSPFFPLALYDQTGKKQALEFAVGDRVVYSKMAGTEVSTLRDEQIILRSDDVLGVLPEGDDIAKLRPSSDRVLVAKASLANATRGGVLLPGSGGGAPTGRVVAVGPGRVDEEGVREAVGIPAGAAVLYASYSGVEYEAVKGDAAGGYVVLRKDDIIVRME